MKRKLFYTISFFLITIGFNSCEDLGGCKFCKQVTTENGSVVQESGETEYCGAQLIAIQAQAPVTVGSRTTSYECR